VPNRPLVSILLPAFNAAATLPACLRSIQRQSETRWECVIVDDGSSDTTMECAQSFAHRDERFTVVVTSPQGIVAALNTGLQRCRAAFVARMDADDLMHRERLAVQVEALERCGWAAMGCHVRLFPRAALTDGRIEYERWLNSIDSSRRVSEEAFVECPIAHPALMIRTAVLRRFGYRDQGWPEDYDLVLRLLASGHDLGVAPFRLICWRDTPNRLSRTHPSYALDRFIACKAAFLAAGLLARGGGVCLVGLWGNGQGVAPRAARLRQAACLHRRGPPGAPGQDHSRGAGDRAAGAGRPAPVSRGRLGGGSRRPSANPCHHAGDGFRGDEGLRLRGVIVECIWLQDGWP
jgi:cellulose synthase/poly-beta-1,6-N-acetylglucosamine synthase-like glycosyltransferase